MRKNCDSCKHDEFGWHSDYCDDCYQEKNTNTPTKWEAADWYEPDTNADRVRAMTDDELYNFIISLVDNGWNFACDNRLECDPIPPQPHLCNDCLREWLSRPINED